MKNRCHNPNDNNYARYGAKGVIVCEAWRTSFVAFRDWALAHGWGEGLEIDRRDGKGSYEPSNCRIATKTQQNANRKKQKRTKGSQYKGVTQVSNKWRANISYNGKKIYIGLFSLEIEAAKAFDNEAKKYFGEFASLNFEESPEAPTAQDKPPSPI